MTDIVTFTADEVTPQRAPVLAHQGITAGRRVSAAVEDTWHAARDLFAKVAEPVAMIGEITCDEFARVYEGEGRNEPRTPVGDLAPRAEHQALFAATIGPRVSREITDRFEANDFALGCMLDSVASIAADGLAERLRQGYCDRLDHAGALGAEATALCYSPGYCGWHISGQGKLFAYLGPGEIGITLRESFLMDPLKSVSGVVLVGPRAIHEFEMDYAFCAECRTKSCRARINALEGK
ncbi:MAG: vitamin B12 dependent-methionine synthase activation domain-containing protein [Planctomycetota bacterium]|jgi:hypothetical protein